MALQIPEGSEIQGEAAFIMSEASERLGKLHLARPLLNQLKRLILKLGIVNISNGVKFTCGNWDRFRRGI